MDSNNVNLLEQDFRNDATRQLAECIERIRTLPASSAASACIQAVYRDLHTLKGAAAMLPGFDDFVQAAHAFETRLAGLAGRESLPDALRRDLLAELGKLQADLAAGGEPTGRGEPAPVTGRSLAALFDHYADGASALAARLGKQVHVLADAGDLHVPAAVHNAVGNVLAHLVRNSIDHGIELPERRKALGKPAYGALVFLAVQRDDRLVLDITDDGAGLQRDAIVQAARARGLAVDDSADDRQLCALVLQPGLSTAPAVSETSGRGVGLDSVLHLVQAQGGNLSLESVPGKGMTVHIELPLTKDHAEPR